MAILKYGYQWGHRCLVPAYIGASEVFKFLSGCFVKNDGSGRLEIAGSGNTELVGWVDTSEYTASSTEGGTVIMVDVSCDSVYLIPADAAPTAALRYKTCDLIVASNIQKADIGESNEDVIEILDIDTVNTAVYVRMNPSKVGTTGVA